MDKQTIVYEVKLQPAVIVLLGVIAVGVVGNVFKSVSPIQDAMARAPTWEERNCVHCCR